jgi:hypothetical protein
MREEENGWLSVNHSLCWRWWVFAVEVVEKEVCVLSQYERNI